MILLIPHTCNGVVLEKTDRTGGTGQGGTTNYQVGIHHTRLSAQMMITKYETPTEVWLQSVCIPLQLNINIITLVIIVTKYERSRFILCEDAQQIVETDRYSKDTWCCTTYTRLICNPKRNKYITKIYTIILICNYLLIKSVLIIKT